MHEIAHWLERLGMSEYAQRFADERIDFSVLPDLTDQDLKDLGVVLGDRRKILRAIAKLDGTPEILTPIPKPFSTPVAAKQPVDTDGHHATLLLCDLVDSTGLAAKVGTEEWRDVVEAYLDAASMEVMDMGGMIAKKLDAGLMALFGYPAMQENDTERAVRAALATQRALTALNRTNADTRWPALAARITIDSGPVAIDAGGEIFGAMPNIVAQAQPLAEPGVVVVTARVRRQVAKLFVAKERGSHQLKGVPEVVTLYRIVRSTGGGHRRPDYDRLLVRALKGVDVSTARQAVYERARNELVAQLRFNQPAPSKVDIAKERVALEEAIRKVEAEATRNWRTETAAEPRSATTQRGASDGGAPTASAPLRRNNRPAADVSRAGGLDEVLPDAREQMLSERSSPKKQAAKSARQTRDSDEKEVPGNAAEELAASLPSLLDSGAFRQESDLEPDFGPAEEQPLAIPPVQRRLRRVASTAERTHHPLSYGGLARLLGVLIIFGGVVVASIFWQWSAIVEFYQFAHTGTKEPNQASDEKLRYELTGRVVPAQSAGNGEPAPYAQTAPAIAQEVVLHEEDPNDQQHRQYRGSAIWRTESVFADGAPQLTIIADAEIPERRMTVAWSLRRNTNKALPASHTIEIKFNVPADFPGGGIANVSGILMAQAEQTRGSPLAGLAVKVMDGFYVIGLSAIEPDIQRNEQLLKGRAWFYIPIAYRNGGRSILAMKKGPPGERAFVEAFTAWEKK